MKHWRLFVYMGLLFLFILISPHSQAAELPEEMRLLEKGKQLMAAGELKLAVLALTESIAAKPTDWAYMNRGKAYLMLKDYDKALSDCSKAIELNPQDAFNYFNRSTIYREQFKLASAIADITQALQLKPGNAFLLTQRGAYYNDAGKYQLALADLNQALASSPLELALVNRGIAYLHLGQVGAALEDFEKAILINNYSYALVSRAEARLVQGYPDMALVDVNRFIEGNPFTFYAYYIRGNAYHLLGQLDNALSDYSQAIAGSRKAAFFLRRGQVYETKKEYTKALDDYRQALSISNQFAEAYYFKGLLENKLGNYQQALNDLLAFCRFANPNDDSISVAEKHINNIRLKLKKAGEVASK